MKKYLQLIASLSALVTYATVVWVGYCHARAGIVNKAFCVDCFVQRVDATNKNYWVILCTQTT
jgi:hypothetical protein